MLCASASAFWNWVVKVSILIATFFLSDNEVLIQLRAKPGFSTEQECCTATLAALRLLAVLAVLAAKARLASAAVQHSCRGSLLFGHTLFSEDLNDLPRVPVATFRLF